MYITKTVILAGQDLTPEELALVYREDMPVALSEQTKQNIIASRKVIDQIVDEDRVVYGITTGLGKFSDVVISGDECKPLWKNLIITHAVGADNPFPRGATRGILLLRINNMVEGFSGCHMEVINVLIEMLDKGVTPQVPEKGSLGASGDLAPLAHVVLPVIDLDQAKYKGEILDSAEAMERAGIPIVELSAKEGLALVNGTSAMTFTDALTVYDALELLKVADIAAALSFGARNGVVNALDEHIRVVRPHRSQIDTARIPRQLLSDSRNTTHQDEIHVQDAYSLRCVPQIHNASRDAISFIKQKVEIEIDSITDDPIILKDIIEGISGGSFHGQPMTLPFDFLGIVIAELASVSECHMERLVNPVLDGPSTSLTKDGGVNSSLMIVQYSTTTLVSKDKVLAHPINIDSIPSSANQEDHVGMGTIAAHKAREILGNTHRVLTVELMRACQAIDMRGDKGMGAGTKPAYDTIRALVSKLEEDRPLYEGINLCESTLTDGSLISHVEEGASEIELQFIERTNLNTTDSFDPTQRAFPV